MSQYQFIDPGIDDRPRQGAGRFDSFQLEPTDEVQTKSLDREFGTGSLRCLLENRFPELRRLEIHHEHDR